MQNQLISYNSNRIILSHERRKKAELDIYPIQHLLTYVKEGVLLVKSGKESKSISRGEFVLLKKFSQATITKTWSGESTQFSSIVFTFQEDLVQEALMQLSLPLKGNGKSVENIHPIASNPILTQFISSLQLFFAESIEMDHNLARLKTLEAIIGIIKSDPALAYQLQSFSSKNKADLYQFMKFNFLQNKDLKDFAKASGRSLSSFKRDFHDIFKMPPRQWLKSKRLEHAYHLLSSTNKKPAQIYLECGFEDLAHFSKCFKELYKYNPSQINELSRQVK